MNNCKNCKYFNRLNADCTECKLIAFSDGFGENKKSPDLVGICAGTDVDGGADYGYLTPREDFGCVLWEEKV